VSIARTILKRPKLLVFDEATSALDTRTEKAIQESLRQISVGVTTLTIAHRLSTVVDADQIVVLEKGSVVERGTHAGLLAADGVYAQMWRRQLETREAQARIEAEAVAASPQAAK
jgi:ATP-binding cassette subfamily B protein